MSTQTLQPLIWNTLDKTVPVDFRQANADYSAERGTAGPTVERDSFRPRLHYCVLSKTVPPLRIHSPKISGKRSVEVSSLCEASVVSLQIWGSPSSAHKSQSKPSIRVYNGRRRLPE